MTRHLVDETLQVVQQGALEHLELVAAQVEPGQHVGQVGIELPSRRHQQLELGEHGADPSRHVARIRVGEAVDQAAQLLQPRQDAGQHLAGDLTCGVGMVEQLLDLTVNQLPTLGELVASPVGEVLPHATRLGLSRAARQVAVLDEVGQARLHGVRVEVEPLLGQSLETSLAD